MVRNLFIIVGLLLIAPSAAEAEKIELAKYVQAVELNGVTTTCTKKESWKERLDCYTTLCEPNFQCAEAITAVATATDGPVVGSQVIHDFLKDPARFDTYTDGHELSHIVGRTTAKVNGVNGTAFESCPDDFLYGCPHGFFEQALAEHEGSSEEVATKICESVETHPVQRSRFYCYHGVGHGIMMAKANDIYESVRICDKMPYVNASRGCWQGAFMENINGFITGTARTGVFDENDLLAPCDKVPLHYQWECYENHGAALIINLEHDLKKASHACMGADERTMPSCILSLAQFTTNPAWQRIIVEQQPEQAGESGDFLETAVHLCTLFPEEIVWYCYHSAMNNMLNYEEWEDAARYCTLLPDTEIGNCVQRYGNEMRWRGFDETFVAEVCAYIPEQWRSQCLTHGDVPIYSTPPLEDAEYEYRDTSQPIRAVGIEEEQPSWLRRAIHVVFAPLLWLSGSEHKSSKPPLELPPNLNKPVDPSQESGIEGGQIGSSTVIRLLPSGTFEPREVTIQAGDTVTWVNDTNDYFWPASDVHPTHELLPEFDARKPLAPTAAYSFTFYDSGEFTFHDHLTPQAVGVVHVE